MKMRRAKEGARTRGIRREQREGTRMAKVREALDAYLERPSLKNAEAINDATRGVAPEFDLNVPPGSELTRRDRRIWAWRRG